MSESGIWIYNVNERACRFVTPGLSPAWSPDGTQLVFSRNRAIWTRDLGSGVETALTESRSAFFPAWSPDGSRIAFDRTVPYEERGIWIMDADGSNPVHFDTDGRGGRFPSWSPSGDELAFKAWDGEFSHLFRRPVAGGPMVQLTFGSRLNIVYPVWSPDGTQIVFDIRGKRRGIGVVDLSTGEVRELPSTAASGVAQQCDWSPDGQSILYNKLELWTIAPDGSGNRMLLGSGCTPP